MERVWRTLLKSQSQGDCSKEYVTVNNLRRRETQKSQLRLHYFSIVSLNVLEAKCQLLRVIVIL